MEEKHSYPSCGSKNYEVAENDIYYEKGKLIFREACICYDCEEPFEAIVTAVVEKKEVVKA